MVSAGSRPSWGVVSATETGTIDTEVQPTGQPDYLLDGLLYGRFVGHVTDHLVGFTPGGMFTPFR